MIFLTDFMDARLQTVKHGVTSAGANQLVVGPVLHDSALFDGDDAIGPAHGGKSMGDDQGGAAFDDLPHIVLDDLLALVVERAGRFVENQNSSDL